MRKLFQITLPDEPYKTATTKNQKVDCMYVGPRYMVLCIDSATNLVKYVGRRADTIEEAELDNHVEDDHYHVLLDASVNTFEAAYLTGLYEHGEVADYTETLPTKNAAGEFETYTYHYDDYRGIIGQIYWNQVLYYNPSNKTFNPPARREHATDWDAVVQTTKNSAVEIRKMLEVNDYFPAQLAAINEYLDWVDTFEEKYADVDHWKVPFPPYPTVD